MNQHEWNICVDGAEMLEVAAGVDRKLLVAAACACARLALPFVPEGEDRPLKAIKAAEGWTRGEVSSESVQAAANAATFASANTAARYAAARAAYAVYAVPAAHAVYAAFYASCAAGGAAGICEKTLAQCADIVREIIPYSLVAVAVLEGV